MGVRNGNESSKQSHARKRKAVAAAEGRAREEQGPVDPAVLDFVRDYTLDPEFFITTLLWVLPIDGGPAMPFRLNPGQ